MVTAQERENHAQRFARATSRMVWALMDPRGKAVEGHRSPRRWRVRGARGVWGRTRGGMTILSPLRGDRNKLNCLRLPGVSLRLTPGLISGTASR
jgi:hypothetical protein